MVDIANSETQVNVSTSIENTQTQLDPKNEFIQKLEHTDPGQAISELAKISADRVETENGEVFLYRYENPDSINDNANSNVSKPDLVGAWFTDSPTSLKDYIKKKQPGGNINVLRIPKDKLEALKAINHPIAKDMDIEPIDNYIVPNDLQNSGQILPLDVESKVPNKFLFPERGKINEAVDKLVDDLKVAVQISSMVKQDQDVRQRKFAGEDVDIAAVDAENHKKVVEIVGKGWPVNADASHNLWLLVQHMDNDVTLQEQSLDLMIKAEASKEDIAYLTDRIRVNKGLPQVYGTQYAGDINSQVLYQIENPEEVEKRRAEMGMMTLVEQESNQNRYAPPEES